MSYRIISTKVSRFAAYGHFVGCRCRCHTSRPQGQPIISRDHAGPRSWYAQHKRWISTQQQTGPRLLFPAEEVNHRNDSSYFKTKYLIESGFLRHKTDFLVPQATVWACIRDFHNGLALYKETESKVEQSVKALKEAVMEKAQLEKAQTEKASPLMETKPKADVVPAKKSIGQRVLDELKHYYHGFRLLFIDIRICMRLLWAMLNGKTLTRRERRQMVRTTADMFRLVPFLVFIVVPFMEFLLPIAVKLFPNMLPSTFQEESKEKEKLKKQLKLKLEMAKFLQDTIHESALQKKKDKLGGKTVQEFAEFIQKVRQEGTQPSMAEIAKFSKLFEDEITMEHLGRGTLQALCRVLSITPVGPDNLLRFQLNLKLRQLKADDRVILREGIDSLSISEVQAACRARGMRSLGVPEDRLRFQLKQWIDMHLNEKIPTSLLLLSRAMYLPETLSTAEQLKVTLSQLPDASVAEGALKVAELSGTKVDNKAKLEIIKSEEEAIKNEQKKKEKEEKEKKKEEEEKKRLEAEKATKVVQPEAQLAAEAALQMKQALREEAITMQPQPHEELKDPEAIIMTDRIEKTVERMEEEEDMITSKDLAEIETAIEQIADKMKISIEKEELKDLKEEVSDYKEDLADLKEVVVLVDDPEAHIEESKAAQRLMKRVDKLISQADVIIDKLHHKKEKFQEELEVKEVRMRRNRELQEDKERMEKILQEIDLNKDNIISINEMVLALKRLQKIPDETKALKILEILDEDNDGNIDVNTVLKVIEELGQENVKMSKKEVTEVLGLLKREEELEHEEKMKEKAEKMKEKSDKLKEEVKQHMTQQNDEEGPKPPNQSDATPPPPHPPPPQPPTHP